MAGKKKRDLLNEKLGCDSQGSLEGFLDNLEAIDALPEESANHSVSKKSSIGLLLTKVFVLTTVVISSLMLFVWPEIKNNNLIIQNYQVDDGKLEQVVGRLEAIEQVLKLRNSDRQDDEPLDISQKSPEAAAKLAQQKAEAAKLANQKAEAAKLANQKAEAAKLANQKAEAAKLAEPKMKLSKFAKMRAEAEAKKKAEAALLLKQKEDVEARLLARKQAEIEAADLVKQQAEVARLIKQEAEVVNVIQDAPDIAISQQKNREAMPVVDEKTATTKVVSPEVTRPYVPFAGKKFYIYKVSANIANVRSAPSSSAKVVAKLKKETKVIVLKEKGDWYQIRLHKRERAWIYHTLLK